MSMYDGMLPGKSIPGKRGYYPVSNKDEWERLPAVYKAMDWFSVPDYNNKNKPSAVKSVIFDVTYLEPYAVSAKVAVHPEDMHKILFCAFNTDHQCHLYSISEIELASGTHLGAKWYQDNTSGAFAVYCGGHLVAKQGGFEGYVPGRVVLGENGKFEYNQNYHSEKHPGISHYTYSNPFKSMGAVKEEPRRKDPTEKLMDALAEYAQENNWSDNDYIDKLVECGVTQEDFIKYGKGDFVKEYFADKGLGSGSVVDRFDKAYKLMDAALEKPDGDAVFYAANLLYMLKDNESVLTESETIQLAMRLSEANMVSDIPLLSAERVDAVRFLLEYGITENRFPQLLVTSPEETKEILLNCDMSVFADLVDAVALDNHEYYAPDKGLDDDFFDNLCEALRKEKGASCSLESAIASAEKQKSTNKGMCFDGKELKNENPDIDR